MNEFVKLYDILLYDEVIPHIYKQDVIKRVNDWCASGGSKTDEYVSRQYEYLLKVKEMIQNKNIAK